MFLTSRSASVQVRFRQREQFQKTEQPGYNGQRVSAKLLGRGTACVIGDPQNVSLQMSPAELHATGVVGQIRYPAVIAEDSAENRAQQGRQHFGAPRGGHYVKDELLGYQPPDPALVAVGPPTRLIYIQDRFSGQLLLQLRHRLCHRLAGFLPGFRGLPKLISMPSTSASIASTSRRGKRQTTVQ